jgi:hypothetical protein
MYSRLQCITAQSLLTMPPDILWLICSFLQNRELISLTSSCKAFRHIADSPHFFSGRNFSVSLTDYFTPGAIFLKNIRSLDAYFYDTFGFYARQSQRSALSSLCRFESLDELRCNFKWGYSIYRDSESPAPSFPRTLRSLALEFIVEFNDMSFFIPLKNLTSLQTSRCRWRVIDALAQLPSLVILDLNNCRNIENFSALSHCTRLQRLNLRATNFSQSAIIAPCRALTWIDLRDSHISENSGLVNLPLLQCLAISNKFYPVELFELRLFSPETAAKISSLNLKFCETLRLPHGFFWNFSTLTNLNLSYCSLDNLDFMRGNCFPLLTDLKLDFNFITSIEPIATLPALRTLSLRGTLIDDALPISRCRTLQRIDVRESRFARNIQSLGCLSGLAFINFAFSRLDCETLLEFLRFCETSSAKLAVDHDARAPVPDIARPQELLLEITGTFVALEAAFDYFICHIFEEIPTSTASFFVESRGGSVFLHRFCSAVQ